MKVVNLTPTENKAYNACIEAAKSGDSGSEFNSGSVRVAGMERKEVREYLAKLEAKGLLEKLGVSYFDYGVIVLTSKFFKNPNIDYDIVIVEVEESIKIETPTIESVPSKVAKDATYKRSKMSLIFKMAHRNARSFEGHYQARMSMGLEMAYRHFNMLATTDFDFLTLFNNINKWGIREVKIRVAANQSSLCYSIEDFVYTYNELVRVWGAGYLFRTSKASNEFHFINTEFQANLKAQEIGLNSEMYQANKIQAGRNATMYRINS